MDEGTPPTERGLAWKDLSPAVLEAIMETEDATEKIRSGITPVQMLCFASRSGGHLMTPRLELPLQATGRSDESPPLPGQLSKRDSRRFLLLQLALLRRAPFQPRANVGVFLGHEVRLHRRISWRGASGKCGEVTGGQKKIVWGIALSRASGDGREDSQHWSHRRQRPLHGWLHCAGGGEHGGQFCELQATDVEARSGSTAG